MLKKKRCKGCGKYFQPQRPLQMVCANFECVRKYQDKKEKKRAQTERKRLKQQKELLKPVSELKKELQVVFNRYIRLRDRHQPCISCGRPLGTKYDAGHLFPVGHYDGIRFDEDNVHAQCVQCNRDKHGNQSEYMLRLPDRIGKDRYVELLNRREQVIKLTGPEIRVKIKEYKAKIKKLKE